MFLTSGVYYLNADSMKELQQTADSGSMSDTLPLFIFLLMKDGKETWKESFLAALLNQGEHWAID